MNFCEESNCKNFKSCICLHCKQNLCTLHIVEHGKILSRDVDELYQEANQLIEHLANASKSADEAYFSAEGECNAWRVKALENIEQIYNNWMQPILWQRESFKQLEQEISRRLLRNAKQPLEEMQTHRSGNNKALGAVRCTLQHVKCIIPLIKWPENPLSPIPKTKVNLYRTSKKKDRRIPPLLSIIKKADNELCTPLNKRSDPNVPTPWQMLMSIAHSNLQQIASTDQIDQNPISASTEQKATIACAAPIQKLTDYGPSEEMINRFADISVDSDRYLGDYLKQFRSPYKKRRKTPIKIVLAFLHAWFRNKISDNVDLILQRVSKIKNYVINDKNKYTVMLAVQVFVHHLEMNATNVQIMTTILEFFLEQQLIQEEDILKWYFDDDSQDIVGFDKAKQCAQSFIENL